MKTSLNLKAVLLPFLVTFVILPSAFAGEGGHNGGGGDSCEDRFKVIAKNLSDWIHDGGGKSLDLSMNGPQVDAKAYSDRMLDQIANARISCVKDGDPGFPVLVNKKAKECKSEVDAEGIRRITCDRAKFYSDLPDPDNSASQYRIVHHEYATLAGLEVPVEDDSDYHLSDQITDSLEPQLTMRLVVKAPRSPHILSTDKLLTVFLTPGYLPRKVVSRVYARAEVVRNLLCYDPEVTQVNDHLVKKGDTYLEVSCVNEGLQLFTFIQCEGERDESCRTLGHHGARTAYEIGQALESVQWLKLSDAILFTSWADALRSTRGFASDYGAQLQQLLWDQKDVHEIVLPTEGPNDRRIFEQLLYYSHDSRCSSFLNLESCSWSKRRL